MTDQSKKDYVKSQGQTRDHACHWPGCKLQVPPAMWGCKAHWKTLPLNLRSRIWETYRPRQEIDMRPSTDYLNAFADVQEWIAKHYPNG